MVGSTSTSIYLHIYLQREESPQGKKKARGSKNKIDIPVGEMVSDKHRDKRDHEWSINHRRQSAIEPSKCR